VATAFGVALPSTLGDQTMSALHVIACWRNTKELPLLVRALVRGAMVVTPLFLLLLVFPFFEWEIDGRLVSFAELWSSGSGIVFATSLLLVGVGAWGFAARSARSRWLLVVSPIAPYLALAAFPSLASEAITLPGVAGSVITVAVFYFVLFHLRSVHKYLVVKGG
jgi:hypothetical protein